MAKKETKKANEEAKVDVNPNAVPSAQLLASYVKDLSFENIAVQNNLVIKSQPKFELNMNVNSRKFDENIFEVSLNVKVKSTEDDQTIFILDLDHAGRFALRDVAENATVPFLYIECPRILYPYTRRIVSTVTMDGGLLPLQLENIDFVQMFQNTVNKAREGQDAKDAN